MHCEADFVEVVDVLINDFTFLFQNIYESKTALSDFFVFTRGPLEVKFAYGLACKIG